MNDRRALFAGGSAASRWWSGAIALGLVFAVLAVIALTQARRARRIARVQHATRSVAPTPVEDARVSLGRKLFFDATLSEPPGTSCASCHDPKQAYAGDNSSDVGTARGSRPGHFARRNTPSVMYLRFVPRAHLVWEDETDRAELFGGFFWDGRANSIAALVREPLLNPDEMANRDLHQIAQKVEAGAYANALRREFDAVFSSDEKTMEAIGLCFEAFLTSRTLAPFSSKYDDFVRGRASFSQVEQRGLALFEDLEKGACGACHRLDPRSQLPESSLFTDHGYDAVAVPRNRQLPETHDPQRFDLGVCERHDPRLHTEDPWFCGAFRTPSLRNVAKRRRFMHNGYFASLRDVVSFYATRATRPERWYPNAVFDDLPAQYHDNVNVNMPPYDQRQGDPPRLNDAEIDAIVAFLGTLSDRDVLPAP